MTKCELANKPSSIGKISDNYTLGPLVVLAAKRLVLGVDVAAAKFMAARQIDDPGREQEILDWAERSLNGAESQYEGAIQFFRDQRLANKVIQRGLHTVWRKQPGLIPVSWLDLAIDVRPQLDVINRHMLLLLMRTEGMPLVRRGLPEHFDLFEVFDATLRTSSSLEQFGTLRQEAADIALRSLY